MALIRVRKKDTNQTGTLEEQDFNPAVYDRLDAAPSAPTTAPAGLDISQPGFQQPSAPTASTSQPKLDIATQPRLDISAPFQGAQVEAPKETKIHNQFGLSLEQLQQGRDSALAQGNSKAVSEFDKLITGEQKGETAGFESETALTGCS